jgi:hypothetical protein
MLSVATTSTAKKIPDTQATLDLAGRLLTIVKAGKVEVYDVAEFPTSWDGRAFELVKTATGEKYSTFVANNPQDHHCDCTGHEAKGYCKHVDALRELWQAGWLEDPRAGICEQIAGPSPYDPHADERSWSEAGARREFLNRIAPFGLTDAEQSELAELEGLDRMEKAPDVCCMFCRHWIRAADDRCPHCRHSQRQMEGELQARNSSPRRSA